jgi:transcription elongation factor Elf1
MVVFYATGIMPPKSNRQIKKETQSASCQHKTANRRDTFVKQVAAKLIPSNRVLGVESLAIANMLLNHCLARSIADAGWRKLFAAIESRAEDNGALIVAVNRFFASSQTCSVCGVKNPAVKNLKVRFWTCPACGAMHQRDLNAAVNMIPTDEKLVAAYTERMERIAAHERSKTKISDRAKKTVATKAIKAGERAEKAERRAADKTPRALGGIAAVSAAPVTASPSSLIPSRAPVVPGLRSVDPIPGETINNSAWRPGKTESAARVETLSGITGRQEARTDASRSRTPYLGGSPPG